MKTTSLALLLFLSVSGLSSLSAQSFGANLIVNGNAESGAPSSDGGNDLVPIPGWTVSGDATVVFYGSSGGFPVATDPGPDQRGNNFFAGGPANEASSITQTIDLTSLASSIDNNSVTANLSAYLGGYSGQDDQATLTAVFLNASGEVLDQLVAGPVTATERGSVNALLARNQTGYVPAFTRSVRITLLFDRASGSYNDGYADNLSLVLTDTGIPLSTGVRIYRAMVATSTTGGITQFEPGVQIAFPTKSGKTYQVVRSGNLTLWSNFGTPVTGTGSMMAVYDRTGGASQLFYRINSN